MQQFTLKAWTSWSSPRFVCIHISIVDESRSEARCNANATISYIVGVTITWFVCRVSAAVGGWKDLAKNVCDDIQAIVGFAVAIHIRNPTFNQSKLKGGDIDSSWTHGSKESVENTNRANARPVRVMNCIFTIDISCYILLNAQIPMRDT